MEDRGFRIRVRELVLWGLWVAFSALFLWQALASMGEPDGWVRLAQRVAAVAFVLLVAVFRILRRPVPVLQSGNPYVSALGWVVVGYLYFGLMSLTAPYQPPPIVWILSGILAYGIIVIVKQINQQTPE